MKKKVYGLEIGIKKIRVFNLDIQQLILKDEK